ncbi:cytochrome c/FTR1 family iron permease [Microbulbifer yueqingensis]|uniref:High-affinity iron transporter n=1 Tax=Microbulbifer yueqingensis TaxID=658219 RepID=A0A1G8W0H5_9GAMM|nr:cytochrome c/FTR1 family iron permease [Microbulbifer yueqingensis]SDJ71851.1 high-affinity iron transporter [Microbulbifer yueqingensis]
MRTITRRLLLLLPLTLFALHLHAQPAGLSEAELRQLMQMAEYIGVDYPEAVEDGEVINSGEYTEMQEFAEMLAEQSARLQPSSEAAAIGAAAGKLQEAIANKASLATVKAHTAKLRQGLLSISPQLSLPGSLLDTAESEALYQSHCVACHGPAGRGDGPLASGLEPPPTNFHDRERAENRSVLGLYDAISNGIDGTAMTSFSGLSERQRWSLAFYVGSLAFGDAGGRAAGSPQPTLEDLVMYSPEVLVADRPGLVPADVAALRAQPAQLFEPAATSAGTQPLETARDQLRGALVAYREGDFHAARTLAVSAYLDGFELVEGTLDSRDVELRKAIEKQLLGLRAQLSAPGDPQQVEQQVAEVLAQLELAQSTLEGSGLSSPALFLASLLILLREGLEALLVVIALTTILLKTGRTDALRYVHLGWVTAFIAGFATWLAAQHLLTISGASREVMEGVAALVAAAVLFYVGFWMHSKTQATDWQQYIQANIDRSLSSGALWGIAGLAFIAVYREIFETILFYQALLTQSATAGEGSLWAGLATGAVLLAVAGWLMVRYSQKLPIGKFFATTTFILLALSFVLAGKAVAALQEAALISMTALPFNLSIGWLGIHPTWEGVGLQLLIALLSLAIITRGSQRNSSTAAVEG